MRYAEVQHEQYPKGRDPEIDLWELMEERDPPLSAEDEREALGYPLCGACFGTGLTRYRRFDCPECKGSGKKYA